VSAIRIAFSLLICGWLTACSNGLEGTYADSAGVTSYEFHRDGRVDISVLGAVVSGRYEVEKDRVLITAPQGTVVFIRKNDGLEGPMGLQLRPQPSG
jgi:hypothetical protein